MPSCVRRASVFISACMSIPDSLLNNSGNFQWDQNTKELVSSWAFQWSLAESNPMIEAEEQWGERQTFDSVWSWLYNCISEKLSISLILLPWNSASFSTTAAAVAACTRRKWCKDVAVTAVFPPLPSNILRNTNLYIRLTPICWKHRLKVVVHVTFWSPFDMFPLQLIGSTVLDSPLTLLFPIHP